MAKRSQKKRKSSLRSVEIKTQTEILIDRLKAQDPNGETLNHFMESLKESLGANRELATAFVEELGGLKLPIAASVFREIQSLFDDKSYRKAVRRTKFRLVQKGILKEDEKEKKKSTEVRYLVTAAEKPLAICYFSVLQPVGEELVLAYIPGGADRDTIIEFDLTAERNLGLLVYEKAYYKRSMAKRLVEHLEGYYERRFVEIPISYGAFLFEEGMSAGVIEGEDKINEARRDLGRYRKEDTRPLIYNYVRDEEIKLPREVIDRGERLIGKENFPIKALPANDKIISSDRLRSVFESTLIVNVTIRKEQLEDIIQEAIRDYLSGDNLERYLRCLEETALYLYLCGEKTDSTDLLGVVKHLREKPEEVTENTFIKKLFYRTAAAILRDFLSDDDFQIFFKETFDELKTGDEREEKERLILTPGELLEEVDEFDDDEDEEELIIVPK